MKTDPEIQEEAVRLERLARHWLSTAGAGAAPATFAVFPETRVGEATRLPRRLLRVEIDRGDDDEPEYLLVQEDLGPGGLAPLSEPLVLTRSDSSYDVLRDGYEAREEDRLGELLAPIADRLEEDGFIEADHPDLVEEITAALEADNLTPSVRIGLRADTAEFLEGRLSPSDFIASTIERRSQREPREHLGECLTEQMSVA